MPEKIFCKLVLLLSSLASIRRCSLRPSVEAAVHIALLHQPFGRIAGQGLVSIIHDVRSPGGKRQVHVLSVKHIVLGWFERHRRLADSSKHPQI